MPFDIHLILSKVNQSENGTYKKGQIPELWDGKATERIIKFISNIK